MASSDILNHSTTFGGAFQADRTKFTFSGQGSSGNISTGLLVQDLQAQYAIAINKIWELGIGNRCYYVVGHPQGSLSMGRIIGPAPINAAFIKNFTDACLVGSNTIGIDSDPGFCDSTGTVVPGQGISFLNCLITSIGLRVSSADMVIMEQIQIMFSSLTDK